MIFGECKNLSNTPKDADTWNEVTDQFLKLASVAEECEAKLVVPAAQVEDFPDHVKQRIKTELSGTIPFLLLNNDDLQKGHRKVGKESSSMRLDLHDLLPKQFPERAVHRTAGPRHINLGWAMYTKQS